MNETTNPTETPKPRTDDGGEILDPAILVKVDLDSPNGPRVTYPATLDGDTVDGAIPEGWEVDWETTPADVLGGRKASPLVRTGTTLTVTITCPRASDEIEDGRDFDAIFEVDGREINGLVTYLDGAPFGDSPDAWISGNVLRECYALDERFPGCWSKIMDVLASGVGVTTIELTEAE